MESLYNFLLLHLATSSLIRFQFSSTTTHPQNPPSKLCLHIIACRYQYHSTVHEYSKRATFSISLFTLLLKCQTFCANPEILLICWFSLTIVAFLLFQHTLPSWDLWSLLDNSNQLRIHSLGTVCKFWISRPDRSNNSAIMLSFIVSQHPPHEFFEALTQTATSSPAVSLRYGFSHCTSSASSCWASLRWSLIKRDQQHMSWHRHRRV